MTSATVVSIIVPAYENPEELERCLRSLRQDDLKDESEIIVIDDCSPEQSNAIEQTAQKYNVGYYRQDKNAGPGVARNRGAEEAKGSILVFIDSDCVAPPGWLTGLIQPIREGRYSSTTSCYSGPASPDWITTFQDEDYRYRMPWTECDISFVNSCNFAIEQKVFQNLGGFPEQRITEDMVFGLMLAEKGMPTRFLPDAGVLHGYYGSIHSYLKQRSSFAYNTVGSYLKRNKGRSEKSDVGVRSFNPFRTAAGMFFISATVVSFALAGILAVLGSDHAGTFMLAGLAGLILEGVVHGRFLLFLINRQGFKRTASYIFLLYLIDLVYVCAVLKALARAG